MNNKLLHALSACVCVIARCSLYNKLNTAQSAVGRPVFRCEKIWHNRKQTVEQCVGGECGKERGASPFSLHRAKVYNPDSMGRITGSFYMFTPESQHVPGSSSHLQVVLLLLQSLEATAVWLALDSHVCLLLQDVQAQLLAAAQALLHAHRQAGMLARQKVIMSTRRMSLSHYTSLCIICFPMRATLQISVLKMVSWSPLRLCVCVCAILTCAIFFFTKNKSN